MEKRDSIQQGEASLLDLRSYLFSRQCTLLIFLQRPWEVTQRALELLHNCVQELRLLEVSHSCCRLHALLIVCSSKTVRSVVEVSVVDGALDCWVFLSCLEVLHRIEGCCDQAQIAANSSQTVGLWAYATDKVQTNTLWLWFLLDFYLIVLFQSLQKQEVCSCRSCPAI